MLASCLQRSFPFVWRRVEIRTYIGRWADQYRFTREPILDGEESYIALCGDLYWVVALCRDKSCGRVADKCGLRTWTINLRAWIFGFTCLVFKTTCIDRRILLREGAFFFTRMALPPPREALATPCGSSPSSPARSPEKHGFARGNQ